MRERKWVVCPALIFGTYIFLRIIAIIFREDEGINDGNIYDRHTDNKSKSRYSIYGTIIKPILAHILSFCTLIVLSPIYALIAIAIKADDPGPVFFSQKRVGKNNEFFMCHKFRTMKMSAPHDVPTHLMKNPEQYITRVGKLLRKTSLDELPQFWDVFRRKMVIIGPRPALWNQDDLIAEREKYNTVFANTGITGYSQISGRDELSISEKARLDGIYTDKLKEGGIKAFLFDCKIFFGTIGSVLNRNGVVEGGTGKLESPNGDKK